VFVWVVGVFDVWFGCVVGFCCLGCLFLMSWLCVVID